MDKEVHKFGRIKDWWDKNGSMRPLHAINPQRVEYIRFVTTMLWGSPINPMSPFTGKKVLDIGAGAGILSENIARLGGTVTALEASEKLIVIGEKHKGALSITYVHKNAEEIHTLPKKYDLILCMELLEHVSNPYNIVRQCMNSLVEKGIVVFATINKNRQSFVQNIIIAEYILQAIPKGTHTYRQFIPPKILSKYICESNGIVKDTTGLYFDLRHFTWVLDKQNNQNAPNYFITAQKKC